MDRARAVLRSGPFADGQNDLPSSLLDVVHGDLDAPGADLNGSSSSCRRHSPPSRDRERAFEAARHTMNEIKRVVPIWKREFFEGGDVWVEGPKELVTE